MNESLQKLNSKVKDIRTCMLTTQQDGKLHSRPMSTNKIEEDGILWFICDRNSTKVQELKQDAGVNLAYVDMGSETYVSVYGMAEAVDDRAKIHELWSPVLKTWWPDGPDSASITLLKVKPLEAEYWDVPGGKLVVLFQMAKGAITGKYQEMGENKKISL